MSLELGRTPPQTENVMTDESDPLTTAELAAVRDAVSAIVLEDYDRLVVMGAFVGGSDPYLWTHDYGAPGRHVHLKLPPGDPQDWEMHAVRFENEPNAVSVDVDMWTTEEGRSDLTLGLVVRTDAQGRTTTTFRDLHVL